MKCRSWHVNRPGLMLRYDKPARISYRNSARRPMAPRPPVRSVTRVQPPERTRAVERARGHASLIGRRPDRRRGPLIVGLLVFAFVCGLGVLAALVPVGHGFSPKGGGWFTPDVVGGVFTLHPLLVAVPSAACFVCGLVDWRRPWRVEHLDLLALAGFFPVAMLLSDDIAAGRLVAGSGLPRLAVRPHARSGLRDMADAGTAPVHQLPVAGPGHTGPAARPGRKSRGGQHPGCRAGELARRLARPARTAPLRGGVLAGPRRAPDLPPGLLRPVRLLRVHPIRGHLPAGAGTGSRRCCRRCASTR